MTELFIALCIALILFVYWVGTGRYPGYCLHRFYRVFRDSYHCPRRVAMRKAWAIWSPWL